MKSIALEKNGSVFRGDWKTGMNDLNINVSFKWDEIPDQGSCDDVIEYYDDQRLVKWETQDSMHNILRPAENVIDYLEGSYKDECPNHMTNEQWRFECWKEFSNNTDVDDLVETTYEKPEKYGNFLDMDEGVGDRIDLGRFVHLVKTVDKAYKTIFQTLDPQHLKQFTKEYELNWKKVQETIVSAKEQAMTTWENLHTAGLYHVYYHDNWMSVKRGTKSQQ